ncbi:hypothetical protein [uncultured Methanolobus sp.]|uniref:hypothetical protein n=1 Tax=uncultured Methanolobus sp. TaxID=218300 RepID=UPI002AAB29BB|nr:hypothetical protein [uncultured Methanolobus sp.]
MQLSVKFKFKLFVCLLILNFIVRNQAVSDELGVDSFLMHAMVNSINEYGYAKWILNPLSFVGLYPGSYTSSMHFLLSGLYQSSGLDMRISIYLYCIFIGFFSIATSYLMAGEIFNDDIYKFITSFSISLSPAVLDYTTWTIPTRGLLTILAPLFIYLLLKCRQSKKFIPLFLLFSLFLLSTHHLFYFLLPSIFAFLILSFLDILNQKNIFVRNFSFNKYLPLIVLASFVFMFSIPFFTGKFVETSRYSPIYIDYIRYTGVLLIPSIGGFFYLLLKEKKVFSEWFLLLYLIFLTPFVYSETYMKGFLPLFILPLSAYSLVNLFKFNNHKSMSKIMLTILIVTSVMFAGFFQFKDYTVSPYTERYLEKEVSVTGSWAKEHLNGSSITNGMNFGMRVFSVSETSYVVTESTILNHVYDFESVNISNYERYPLTSESFWFSGYKGKDAGLAKWEKILRMWDYDYKVRYLIENTRANGLIVWNHQLIPCPLLAYAANSQNKVYDNGVSFVWTLDELDKDVKNYEPTYTY